KARPGLNRLSSARFSMRRETDGSIISTDYQALSLFRITFAAYLFADFFLATFPFFNDLYSETGILPIDALSAENRPGLSLVLPLIKISSLVLIESVFATIYSVALIAFAVGYRTRVSNAFVFILNSYLYWRNPYLNSGAEILARLLLLWCIFLP